MITYTPIPTGVITAENREGLVGVMADPDDAENSPAFLTITTARAREFAAELIALADALDRAREKP